MFSDTPCVCIPFTSNPNKHPSENDLVGMILFFENGVTELINFNHPDAKLFNGTLNDIKLHKHSLMLDKKTMLYFGYSDGVDLNSYMQYYIDDYIEVSDNYPKTISHFMNTMRSYSKLGHVIPLSKWIEFANTVYELILPYFKPHLISDKCIKYCDDYCNVFFEIEKNVIPVNDEMRHQYYWWYTATSRPSNTWDGYNFSALNKKDGSRDSIHSRYDGGKLVQFDYDAFHIKLLSKILNYSFKKHPYIQIKEDLNLKDEYDKIKTRVFQNIYGGITDEFISHPFFQGVQAVIDELYDEYVKNGFVESWFYGKKFRDIDGVTPNKLFNYFLQSLETEYNVQKIKTFLPVLNGKKTKFSMYMWDAFIFDVPPEEVGIIDTLKLAFTTDDMSVKISIGDTFGSMNQI